MKLCSSGFGLVELLVAVACFLAALVPLLSLFSVSVDGANVVQLRAQSCSIAQELISQAVLTPPERLVPGGYTLTSAESGPEFARTWQLSPLPKQFSRQLIVSAPTNGKPCPRRVQVLVRHETLSQADLSLFRLVPPIASRSETTP